MCESHVRTGYTYAHQRSCTYMSSILVSVLMTPISLRSALLRTGLCPGAELSSPAARCNSLLWLSPPASPSCGTGDSSYPLAFYTWKIQHFVAAKETLHHARCVVMSARACIFRGVFTSLLRTRKRPVILSPCIALFANDQPPLDERGLVERKRYVNGSRHSAIKGRPT